MKYLIIAALLFPLFIFAQTDSTKSLSAIETIIEDGSSTNDVSHIYYSLEDVFENPIDINNASVDDLLQIPLLNKTTAQVIINYRNYIGNFTTLGQLKNVEGISNDLAEKIITFLKISGKNSSAFIDSFSKMFLESDISLRSRIIQDLQPERGFRENLFQGSKQKFYNRLIINSSDKFKFGLLIEKDAGEKSFTDFVSYSLQINNLWFIKSIVAGNYNFEFAQGLAMWSPFGLAKGSDAVNTVSKNARGAVSSVNPNENQFLNGCAINFQFNKIYLKTFFSSHFLDASIDSITGYVSSLPIDGNHRTANEIKKHSGLKENILGISGDYFFNNSSKIGILYYQSNYDHYLDFENYTGEKFEHFSFGYSAAVKRLLISGEIANHRKSIATINAVQFLIGKKLSFVFSYRNFPPEYNTIHRSSFGEKGTAANESGFYTGFYWQSPVGSFNIYFDQFKFPIASPGYNFSSTGNDFRLFYIYKLSSSLECRIRYKNENNPIFIDNDLSQRKSNALRAELLYKISKGLKLRTRFEIVHKNSVASLPAENGYLFFQDINSNQIRNLSLICRIIFFRTDSYESRLYEFENDLDGIMNNPALFGEGMRWYFICRYKTSVGLNLSLKYSELYKPNEESISSGLAEIDGNVDNRISIQIDFNF
jgi:competence ComEA-like helix-hairpin-helix protein